MDRANNPRFTLLCCALLASAVVLVFWPVLRSDFVFYDDAQYITDNPHVLGGLTWPNVRWAFGTFHASNWHPLTWLSHMLDVQLFGTRPGLHHLTNLVLHVGNTLLLFLLLKRMTGAFWRSAFVAALFGIHPMHVESVAWIAERKDVLSGLFFMLTLLAYGRYAQSEVQSPKSKVRGSSTPDAPFHAPRSTLHAPRSYLLSLFFFALGLMSKPMLVTVPFVLVLLDYWPLQRLELTTKNSKLKTLFPLLLEKLPFFVLSLVSSVITYRAQQTGGSVESLEALPIGQRLANATMAYALYLWKLLWPAKLNILYLRVSEWQAWQIGVAVVVLVGITVAALMTARKYCWFAVGWCWFVGMLVPVIGLVQVGNQLMADRYSYLPSIGFFIVMAWTGWTLVQRFAINPKPVMGVAAAILVCAGWAASRQTLVWQNCETLFGHSLKLNPENYVAHNILGTGLRRLGKMGEAKAHYLAALRVQPEHPDVLNNLGVLLTEQGQYSDATNYLAQAVQLKPALTANYCKLAFFLDAQGKAAPAIIYYRECLRLDPDNITGCNNLAWLLATQPDSALRNGGEAVQLAEHANQLTSYQQPALLGTLAAAYAEAGRFSDAMATAEKARDLANASGLNEIAARNNSLLEVYRKGQPYREGNDLPK